MAYEYDTVQIPPILEINTKAAGNEAAAYLKKELNIKAAEGWEFQSIETIGISVDPGCIEALKGTKKSLLNYYVIVFRREVA